MKALVTGATGFVGSHVVKRLLADGHAVRALVRTKAPRRLTPPGVETAEGDVSEPGSLAAACDGADAVIHLVGIIVEKQGAGFERVVADGTRNLVRAAVETGVKKFVYVSAMGASAGAKSRYHNTKWAAEEAVRNSGLNYTIVRPSIIFGPEDKFINSFAGKFVPFPGGGRNLLQPVYVEDVATVLSRALTEPACDGQSFDLGGPQRFEMREVIAIAEAAFGVRGKHPSFPLGFAKLAAAALFGPLSKLGLPVPVTSDQLLMLSEPNVCSDEEVKRVERAFKLRLTPLEEGLRSYAA